MLTQALQEIIEKNLQRIYKQTPLNDILYVLHSQHVLSEGEVDTLNEYKSKQRQNFEFIKILRSRDDEDFEKFCYALSNHDTKAVKDFGNELLKKIQNPSNLDDDGTYSRSYF